MTDRPILTVTLNPALDITVSIGKLTPMRKLRCSTPRYDPGGGGVNVSRAIKELGGTSRAFIALAGATGEQYREVLASAGLDVEVWKFEGETRFSLTVMEESTGEHYRFVLPGPAQDEAVAGDLLEAISRSVGGGGGFVVASGSLPPGLPADFFARLTRRTRDLGAQLVLDTSGPALRAALAERPYIVRMNHIEAHELAGGGEDTPEAVEKLADRLLARGAAEIVIIALGAEGSFVATEGTRAHIRPPAVPVVSMVGAGDSSIGATTLALARGWPLIEACAFGVAAAASAVTTEATQLCRRPETERYFRQIVASIASHT